MELDKAIDSLAQTNVKFNETLNTLAKSVQWLSIISLIYYIVTVLVVAAYIL